MAALQKEGKLRHIGVSNFNAEQLARVEAIAPVISLQPPYSALRRDIEASTLPVVPGAPCRRDRLLAHAVRAA